MKIDSWGGDVKGHAEKKLSLISANGFATCNVTNSKLDK